MISCKGRKVEVRLTSCYSFGFETGFGKACLYWHIGLFWSICHAAVEDVIRCVALFYKAGTSGKDYIRKEKFRIRIPRGEDGKEIKLARLKDIVWYVDRFLFKY